MLCLEAESVPPAIYLAAFSLDRAIQEIAGIELHSRLGRADFQNSPSRRFFHPRRQHEPVTPTAQYPVVIVAPPDFELFVVVLDPGPNRRGAAEIERRSRNRPQFP